MTGVEIVSAIIEILTAALTGIGTAMATAVNSIITTIFFVGTGSDQALSMFAILVIGFFGIGLALGLVRLLFNWLAGGTKGSI